MSVRKGLAWNEKDTSIRIEKENSAMNEKSRASDGYGRRRNVTLGHGTITARRPLVRDVEERFESRLLPFQPT